VRIEVERAGLDGSALFVCEGCYQRFRYDTMERWVKYKIPLKQVSGRGFGIIGMLANPIGGFP
jgi:hypothetical protein